VYVAFGTCAAAASSYARNATTASSTASTSCPSPAAC